MLQTENSHNVGERRQHCRLNSVAGRYIQVHCRLHSAAIPGVAFAVIAAIALGLIYILTTPPSFTALPRMLIDTKKVQLFGQQSIFSDLPIDSSTVESQVEILKSETIALAVIKQTAPCR